MGVGAADVVVHAQPAWRSRANFIIRADIEEPGLARRIEQLWARQLDEASFEVCCIPFFAYDLALGDVVRTDGEYVVRGVVTPSGHYTFRVWFGDGSRPSWRPADVLAGLEQLGCLTERYSPNLVALDARDERHARDVADVLQDLENSGALRYETGRTAGGR